MTLPPCSTRSIEREEQKEDRALQMDEGSRSRSTVQQRNIYDQVHPTPCTSPTAQHFPNPTAILILHHCSEYIIYLP
jgi:hypothetical protein